MNSQKTIWNKKRSAKRTANHANRAYVINRMSIKALNSKEQYWKKKKGSEAEVEVALVLFPHSRSSS